MSTPQRIPRESIPCRKCNGEGSLARVNGAAMRRIRERSGMSLRTLAAKLEIGHTYLGDMERGSRNMPEDVAIRIMEICHAR